MSEKHFCPECNAILENKKGSGLNIGPNFFLISSLIKKVLTRSIE